MKHELLRADDIDRINQVLQQARQRGLLSYPVVWIGVGLLVLFGLTLFCIGMAISLLLALGMFFLVCVDRSLLKGRWKTLKQYVRMEEISKSELMFLQNTMQPVHFERIHRIRDSLDDRTLRVANLEKMLVADQTLRRVQSRIKFSN